MKRKYNAGDHDSSIINTVCFTLEKKKKKGIWENNNIPFHTTERVILLGVKLSAFKENSWLQRVPLLCRFWCLFWVFYFMVLPATQWLNNCFKMTSSDEDEKSHCNVDGKTTLRLKLLLEIDKWALAHQMLSKLTHWAVSDLSREIL